MEYGRNYMPEKWCVSEFCLNDEVRASMKLPKSEDLQLRDSTIREGDETPGCYMPPSVKLKIARKLWDIGFKEIDVGFVGTVKEHFEAASLIHENILFFTIEKCAKFQPKTVPLNTKKLISFNPSFPPSLINNRHTFTYTGKIIKA